MSDVTKNTKITKNEPRPALGPTAFKIGHHQGNVIMLFSIPTRDVTLTASQARHTAQLLVQHADLAESGIILPPGMTREAPVPEEPET